MAGTNARTAGNGGQVAVLLLALVVPGVLAVAAPAVLVLLAGALPPTLAAFVIDRSRERHAAFAIGVLNLVGAAPYVFDLLGPRATVATALATLGDPFALAAMYGAAAVGWALVLTAPSVARIWLGIAMERRLTQLRRFQKLLVEEWGEAVADDTQSRR